MILNGSKSITYGKIKKIYNSEIPEIYSLIFDFDDDVITVRHMYGHTHVQEDVYDLPEDYSELLQFLDFTLIEDYRISLELGLINSEYYEPKDYYYTYSYYSSKGKKQTGVIRKCRVDSPATKALIYFKKQYPDVKIIQDF